MAPYDGTGFSDLLLLVSGDFLFLGTQCKLPEGTGWHQEAPNAPSVLDSLALSVFFPLSGRYSDPAWETSGLSAVYGPLRLVKPAWFQLFALLLRNHRPVV